SARPPRRPVPAPTLRASPWQVRWRCKRQSARPSAWSCCPPFGFSERFVVGFAGADAHGAVEVVDEDFSVADLAGLGGCADCRDRLLFQFVGDRDLDLELGQEVHGVFGAAIDFGVALLPAEALDLGDGHAVDADDVERVADFVELEGFDDGDDELHGDYPLVGTAGGWPPDRQRKAAAMVLRRASLRTISAIRPKIKRGCCLIS